jgi:hypothetical protein
MIVRSHVLAKLLALAALACTLSACSRITAANYDKLKGGQSYDEVRSLLGDPARCDEAIGFRSCHWGDDKSYIVVNFAGGKAILFSAENIK